MKAITVVPGKPDQVQVSDLPERRPEPATLLMQGRLLGICRIERIPMSCFAHASHKRDDDVEVVVDLDA